MSEQSLRLKIEADISNLKKGMADASKEVSGFKNEIETTFKSVGQNLSATGKSMTTKISAPIVAASVVAFKYAADFEDAMGATEQIFKGSSNHVKDWADNLESYYGIAEKDALEYVNVMGSMLKNIGGLTEEEAAKTSETLVELAGDLSATFGGTTEDAVRAITGALKGNNTMLDNYGMGVNETTIKAKALEMGLYDGTGAMDLQTRQAATLALIMEQTGDAQGQAAREADGASGSIKAITAELKNLATTLGSVLLPIITPIIAKITDWVKKFQELSPTTQEIIVKAALLVAAIGPILMMLGSMSTGIGNIIGLGTKLADNWGTISKVGSVLSSGLTKGIGFLFSPAGLIILGIAAVIAIGVLLYKNWDTIKEHAQKLWDKMKEVFTVMKDTVVIIFNHIKDTIEDRIELTLKIIQTTLNIIKTVFTTIFGAVKTIVMAVFNHIKDTIEDRINLAKSIISTALNLVKAIFSGDLGEAKDIVLNIFDSIKDAISDKINAAKDKVGEAIEKIKGFFDFEWSLPEIKLPSLPSLSKRSSSSSSSSSTEWRARGAIFKKPTVLGNGQGVGDASNGRGSAPEVVAPLSDLKQMLGLDGRSGAGQTINIYSPEPLDPSEVARLQKRASKQMALGWK